MEAAQNRDGPVMMRCVVRKLVVVDTHTSDWHHVLDAARVGSRWSLNPCVTTGSHSCHNQAIGKKKMVYRTFMTTNHCNVCACSARAITARQPPLTAASPAHQQRNKENQMHAAATHDNATRCVSTCSRYPRWRCTCPPHPQPCPRRPVLSQSQHPAATAGAGRFSAQTDTAAPRPQLTP